MAQYTSKNHWFFVNHSKQLWIEIDYTTPLVPISYPRNWEEIINPQQQVEYKIKYSFQIFSTSGFIFTSTFLNYSP